MQIKLSTIGHPFYVKYGVKTKRKSIKLHLIPEKKIARLNRFRWSLIKSLIGDNKIKVELHS